jgi:hypothetical protein
MEDPAFGLEFARRDMRGLFAGLLVLVQAVSSPSQERLTQMLANAGQQVRQFERDFALVISDEDYQQHAGGRAHVDLPQHRHTRAEMLFIWLPDERVWLTVRNVLNVDGREVAQSRDRLRSAVGEPGGERLTRLRRLVDESARFNVGRAFRNFNYPTLALAFLDPAVQPRFTFTLAGRERVGGTDAWKINYVEHASPTVIQGDGADRISRGSVWIAIRDSVVVRTRLDLRIPGSESSAVATVEVDYAPDAKLAVWVPVKMKETYTEMTGSTVVENIGGEATYSNFRRFETFGRIVSHP